MLHASCRFGSRTIPLVAYFALAFLAPAGPAAAQDARAVRQVEDLRSRGTRIEDIVAQITKEFRLDERGAATVLNAAHVEAAEAATGLERTFRLDATRTATALARAGYRADQTAPALVRVYRAPSSAVVDALRVADYDLRDIHLVAINVLQVPANEMAVRMKNDGSTVLEVAAVLKDAYRLAPAPGGDILQLEAQFPATGVVEAFRLVWLLDVHQAYQALVDMTSDFSTPYYWLEAAGYEVVQPVIERYRIADYRPGRSGQYLDNVGVVDPDRVIGIATDASDGLVEVLLRQRDLDGVEADFFGTPGEIVARVPHTFQADGTTWSGEWLHIRFRDFQPGWFRISRLSRTAVVSAEALAYHVIDPAMIVDPISALTVSLGDPQGSATLSLPGGTYGGIAMEGETLTFEVPTHQEAGITADVIDFASNGTTVVTRSVGGNSIEIEIDLSFETGGAEVSGTFLDYIPCWKCGTFEVPKTNCNSISIPCFLSALGAFAASLGSCTDPANWEEASIASGPDLPFQADLTAPALEIRIVLEADPSSGAFAVKQVLPKFEAGVSLRTTHEDLQLYVIQDYIMGRVNARLVEALTELDLGGKVVASLETARAAFGWGNLRGLYLLTDGRWFLDAEY